jgi:hypothetical protein
MAQEIAGDQEPTGGEGTGQGRPYRFDRVIERARERLKEQPTRTTLSRIEIARMAEYHYATVLGNDAAVRRNARQVAAKFQDGAPPVAVPSFGLTDEFDRIGKSYEVELKPLARGNIEYIVPEIEELLEIFGLRLDPTTASYRALGAAVLTEHVKALQAVQRRHAGEPVETPLGNQHVGRRHPSSGFSGLAESP